MGIMGSHVVHDSRNGRDSGRIRSNLYGFRFIFSIMFGVSLIGLTISLLLLKGNERVP